MEINANETERSIVPTESSSSSSSRARSEFPRKMRLLRHLSGLLESKKDLMNDWEIGGTQNKWVCPSDRHLQLRAQLKAGWSVRTATARSPTNSKANSGITDAEQEHIRQVLAKAEESRMKEMERLGKMVERLEKMKSRATGNGVTHCVLCKTEFGLLASKSYAAMCNDCRKYVCQRNCGVETMDPTRGTEMIFLCKICSEAREVLWKKSGAWFYKELPEYVKPEPPNGNVSSPPMHSRSAWVLGTIPRNSPSTSSMPTAAVASSSVSNSMIPPEKAPRRHLPIAPPEPRSSSDGEFVQSGVPRKPQRTPSANRREANLARFSALQAAIRDNDSESDDDSSPESRASTRSTSPRRSLATPSSYDSSQKDLRQSDTIGPDDARSIDSGVVQSDHSNPQAALTLSASSLAPLANHINDSTSNSRISQDYTNARIAQSASGSSLVTPPPIPPRTSSPNRASDERQSSIDCTPSMKLSFSSAASTKRAGTSSDSVNVPAEIPKPAPTRVESPSASFMSSPDDDSSTLGSIQFSLLYSQLEKKLDVHLIRAKNLKAMDSNGFSDPYVKLHLLPGNAKATKLTSKTIEKTLNPEWDEHLTYHGITEEDKLRKTLRVTVLDRDRIGSDFLGETRIALKKLPNNQLKKFNLYLEHAIPVQPSRQDDMKERGKIFVGIQYNIQQGSLFVTLKRCAELIGMDSTGFSDPYCKVSLTPITSKAHRQKTSIKKRTLNPEFNETLQFIVPFKDLPKKTLQIGVYDHDLGRHDDYIGGILLSTSAKGERGQQWTSCIENPGQLFENWHKLELDS
ncbi:unnamed protein product [Auanema sp. JU1783]|nr:unnamed protein product [Auanema sp. JU1783]